VLLEKVWLPSMTRRVPRFGQWKSTRFPDEPVLWQDLPSGCIELVTGLMGEMYNLFDRCAFVGVQQSSKNVTDVGGPRAGPPTLT